MFVCYIDYFFFFKQKTAYEMRISDWSSDVCSSDLRMVRRMESNMLAKAHDGGLDPTATDAIGKLARIAIFVTAALVILQTLGFSVAGLLALGGAGGIAIGFAAQSLEIGRASCRERVCQSV